MCYYQQTRWICGYWKWGNFREQCYRERRTGETCGLKLIYHTDIVSSPCKVCDAITKKVRRMQKMKDDIYRWQREGGRRATIEKTQGDILEINAQVEQLYIDHYTRVTSINY
ncbi:hypothetical protein MMYC01_200470 [Madurella mycetomatis]|uniref:Uncharacterized protein n=1 Tax=Madurella mycetomatis TaxID=100816 RepID=A0A175WHX5_9PEZI|nr:hypothetical protein MMYC01_200470 [Madurella mycetomatis]